MKRVDLIRELEKSGCIFLRHGGRHDWYHNPRTGASQPYPVIERSKSTWPDTSSEN